MPVVLIAGGPNSLEIPCRIFENMGQGKAFCNELFGRLNIVGKVLPDSKILYTCDLSRDKEPERSISNELFTGWCYRYGSPWVFSLKEVSYNEKFVEFGIN